MSEIIPAVLATDIQDFKSKLSQIPDEVKFVHIDVLEDDIWADIGIDFEVHLMVKEPDKIISKWIKRGAKRIIVHSLGNLVSKLPKSIEIGLGVELYTSLRDVFPFVHEVDFLHLMSIDALGTQGDNFEPIIFDRIKEVKKEFPHMVISIDGGINTTNYQALNDLKVDRLIVGSGFKNLWESLMRK